jgi:hypothetical protein
MDDLSIILGEMYQGQHYTWGGDRTRIYENIVILDNDDGRGFLAKFGALPPKDWFEAKVADLRSQEKRVERNAKLAASDWTQVADAPVDKAAWATYRQALRDISDQAGFPWTIEWPTQP